MIAPERTGGKPLFCTKGAAETGSKTDVKTGCP
jgi:hypothetical protein